MIKVENNAATREPIPVFLLGLSIDSLADLSWTDPALGVAGAAWWPEVQQRVECGPNQRLGEEVLTVDAENKRVIVTKQVLDMTPEEVQLAAAAARDAALAECRRLRAAEYPPVTDYLDGIVKGDQAQVQAYIDACLAVKAKYPKPA